MKKNDLVAIDEKSAWGYHLVGIITQADATDNCHRVQTPGYQCLVEERHLKALTKEQFMDSIRKMPTGSLYRKTAEQLLRPMGPALQ